MNNFNPIVLVLLGDGAIGKRSLMVRCSRGVFSDAYSVKDIYSEEAFEMNINGNIHRIIMRHTPGQESYDRLRPLHFNDASCYILCYSAINRQSKENITDKWLPHLKEFYQAEKIPVPMILVTTKIDLRNKDNESHESAMEGRMLMDRIDAQGFAECSAKLQIGLRGVLELAVNSYLNGVQNLENNDIIKKKKCILS